MTYPSTNNAKTTVAVIAALAGLAATGLTGYISLAREVSSLPTVAVVRMTVSDMTSDKLSEIIRRLERIENNQGGLRRETATGTLFATEEIR